MINFAAFLYWEVRSINGNINDIILKAVDIVVEKRLKDLTFDVTRIGRISKVLANNRYAVMIDGSEYVIQSFNSYAVNDSVYVLMPQNNKNKLYLLPKGTPPTINIDGVNGEEIQF